MSKDEEVEWEFLGSRLLNLVGEKGYEEALAALRRLVVGCEEGVDDLTKRRLSNEFRETLQRVLGVEV